MQFLTRAEVDALLAAPDQSSWFGRRDYDFLLVAVQTGLRVSEMTGLTREDVVAIVSVAPNAFLKNTTACAASSTIMFGVIV